MFVAVPAFDGKVSVETARSLLIEQGLAMAAGVEMQVAFLPGCSLITHARNQLAADFMASTAERLVFVDADVAWEPGDLLGLAAHPVDVVGGAYRFKTPDERYPVEWLQRPAALRDDGLGEVSSLPTGFLAISRAAFERLAAAHPDRAYQHMGRDFHAFFHSPAAQGRLLGEDTAFCFDWQALGGQVWLDPNLTLTHVGGACAYAGNIGAWLKGR